MTEPAALRRRAEQRVSARNFPVSEAQCQCYSVAVSMSVDNERSYNV